MLEAAANAAANAIGMEGLGAFGEMANEYKVYADDGGQGWFPPSRTSIFDQTLTLV